MADSIILIGPRQAGKSTVGRLLAEERQQPFCDLPALSHDYWSVAGFDNDRCRELAQQEGQAGLLRYLAPFEVHTLERGLQEHPGSVIEVGAPQVVQEVPELAQRVKTALAPYSNVILLLPAPDLDESERVLQERSAPERIDGREFDAHFLTHHSNFDLAKQIFYTQGKTPQQSCDEILAWMTPGAEIVLIGPMNAGKSTLGRLLAERLGWPNISMDTVRWDYYKEIGWDGEAQNKIAQTEGFAGVYRYWKPFELHALGRLLAAHQHGVFDLGAGHSVYEDEAQFAHARELLAPYPNVFLLLPAPDLDESLTILRERSGATRHGLPLDRFFLNALAGSGLATHRVYTEGHTPEQTRDSILGLPAREQS